MAVFHRHVRKETTTGDNDMPRSDLGLPVYPAGTPAIERGGDVAPDGCGVTVLRDVRAFVRRFVVLESPAGLSTGFSSSNTSSVGASTGSLPRRSRSSCLSSSVAISASVFGCAIYPQKRGPMRGRCILRRSEEPDREVMRIVSASEACSEKKRHPGEHP
jgi:hypothetical protein